MKICWDNLEKLRYNPTTEKWVNIKSRMSYVYVDSCGFCRQPFLADRSSPGKYCSSGCAGFAQNEEIKNKISSSLKAFIRTNGSPSTGKKLSRETKRKISQSHMGIPTSIGKLNEKQKGDKHPSWRGGVTALGIPLYETYADRLKRYEKVKRDSIDPEILNVQCAYCGQWIIPGTNNVVQRLKFINGKGSGENRFYCEGSRCRNQCPIYRRRKYEQGYAPSTSREMQPQLRKLVFERDSWACQLCGSDDILHCHHFTGIAQDPLGSADMDNCMTVCKECHRQIHSQKGCRNIDLQCRKAA